MVNLHFLNVLDMNFRLSDDSFEVDIIGKEELNVVARLLGISTTLLWQGITTRTHTVRGQPVKSMSDANLVRTNSLFLAFYSKTLISFILLNSWSLTATTFLDRSNFEPP